MTFFADPDFRLKIDLLVDFSKKSASKLVKSRRVIALAIWGHFKRGSTDPFVELPTRG